MKKIYMVLSTAQLLLFLNKVIPGTVLPEGWNKCIFYDDAVDSNSPLFSRELTLKKVSIYSDTPVFLFFDSMNRNIEGTTVQKGEKTIIEFTLSELQFKELQKLTQ